MPGLRGASDVINGCYDDRDLCRFSVAVNVDLTCIGLAGRRYGFADQLQCLFHLFAVSGELAFVVCFIRQVEPTCA